MIFPLDRWVSLLSITLFQDMGTTTDILEKKVVMMQRKTEFCYLLLSIISGPKCPIPIFRYLFCQYYSWNVLVLSIRRSKDKYFLIDCCYPFLSSTAGDVIGTENFYMSLKDEGKRFC